jgi:hypothetical protein
MPEEEAEKNYNRTSCVINPSHSLKHHNARSAVEQI